MTTTASEALKLSQPASAMTQVTTLDATTRLMGIGVNISATGYENITITAGNLAKSLGSLFVLPGNELPIAAVAGLGIRLAAGEQVDIDQNVIVDKNVQDIITINNQLSSLSVSKLTLAVDTW